MPQIWYFTRMIFVDLQSQSNSVYFRHYSSPFFYKHFVTFSCFVIIILFVRIFCTQYSLSFLQGLHFYFHLNAINLHLIRTSTINLFWFFLLEMFAIIKNLRKSDNLQDLEHKIKSGLKNHKGCQNFKKKMQGRKEGGKKRQKETTKDGKKEWRKNRRE